MFKIFLIFLIAFGASFTLVPGIVKFCRRHKLLDRPGRRKIHHRSIPTLGGVALYFGFLVSVFIAHFLNPGLRRFFLDGFKAIFYGGSLVLLVGILDDLKKLPPVIKITGQITAALILFIGGLRIEYITNPFGGDIHFPLILSVLFTVCWISAITNAVNLIDGLDGLASGIVFIASTSLLFIALATQNMVVVLLLAALAGASLGFLPFNFYPAKIFMGDTGSMFLGFTLGAISIVSFQYKITTAVALLIPLTALAIPVSDTILAIARRMRKRVPVFKADRRHLHHRLLNMGLSPTQVLGLLYLVGVYFGIIAFLLVLIPNEYAFVLLMLLAIGVFIGIRTLGFIERRMRRTYQK
jgi:UDP-GlcNAc:undecaprenyl-phosphate GlcNAc-1-phosphate transferase